MRISSEVFGAYLNCPTKSWLRASDHPPTGSAYSEWLKAQNDSYRTTEREQLAAESANDEVALLSDRENTKSGNWCLAPGLAVQVKMDSCVLESELHAAQRVPAKGRGKPIQLIPIRFAFKNKLARDDGLLLAFDAFVLSKSLGREVSIGKIMHGDERAAMTVKTSALAGEVRKRIEKITALLSSPTPIQGRSAQCPRSHFHDEPCCRRRRRFFKNENSQSRNRKRGPVEVGRIREMWEVRCNRALRKAGFSENVTRNSLKALGIDRPATSTSVQKQSL